MPRLSVLMASLASRPYAMADELHRQCSAYAPSEVELLIATDNGERTSGQKRQYLAELAKGEYRLFVDDDDEISPDFIQTIYDACACEADVISYDLRMTRPNKPDEIWQFGLWPNTNREEGLNPRPMSINHLCAWKKSIADRVAWCPALGYGDDELWFRPILSGGFVSTNLHIPKVLYKYIYHPNTTVNQTSEAKIRAMQYIGVGLFCYRDPGNEIWIQCGFSRPRIVRNRRNEQVSLDDAGNLVHFYTHRLKL